MIWEEIEMMGDGFKIYFFLYKYSTRKWFVVMVIGSGGGGGW